MRPTALYILFSMALLAQGGFRGPGRYEIYSPLSKKVLDMDRNDRHTIIQYDARRTDNQMWDFTDAGGGYFYVRNAMNGYALAVQDNRNSSPLIAEPFNSSANQQWRVEGGNDNSGILVNRNGKAIDIPYGSTNNGTKLNSYDRNNEVNQRFQFQPVAGSSSGNRPNRYDTNDTVRPGRGGTSRYDTPIGGPVRANGTGQRDSYGRYFDEQDRMYKMDGDGVCFYSEPNYRGEAVCASVRSGRPRWESSFTNIGSVKFFGRATGVQVFDREEFRGNSVEVTGDEPNFGRGRTRLRAAPRSLRVY